jgi:hypothetical protein
MLAVATVVSRRGRAFSGAAAARVVGGVGRRTCPPPTAPRLPRRDDGLRTVAWLPRSWWGPFVSEGIFRLQLMRAGRVLRRARLRPINLMGGERAVFTLVFSTSPFLLLAL